MKKSRKHTVLNKREEQVLRALAERRIGGAALARELKLPRTTLDYILRKLQARGFVKRVYVGGQVRWTRESQETCFELYEQTLNTLFNTQETKQLQKHMGTNTRYLSGTRALFQFYVDVVSSKTNIGRHFQSMQSVASGDLAIQKLRNLQLPLDHKVNSRVVQDEMVTEAIVPNTYYQTLGEKAGKQWLEQFARRTASTAVMQEEFIQFSTELWLYNGKVGLLNWEDEHGLIIENPGVHAMFQTFFTFMHHSGKRIDQNAHVRELLKKMEEQKTRMHTSAK